MKCTGGKGLHVSVPLAEKNSWEEVKGFCADVAQTMVREVPDAYVSTMSKAKRKGKIFLDYFRNDYTATAIADFSLRARAGAPVAVPLEWREIDGLRAANQFTINDVLKRLKKQPSEAGRYENRQTVPVRHASSRPVYYSSLSVSGPWANQPCRIRIEFRLDIAEGDIASISRSLGFPRVERLKSPGAGYVTAAPPE